MSRHVLALLLLGASALAETPTRIEREVIHLTYDSFESTPKLFTVPEADRLEVVTMLRSIARKPRGSDIVIKSTMVSPDGAGAALIRLGDEEFMEEYVLRYRKIKGQTLDSVLRGAQHPLLIPHLAKGLFDSEDFKDELVGGDILFDALPVACAQLILSNLQLDVFPKLVRKQAKDSSKHHGKELVMLMRRWWTENRAAFQAKKFQGVTPPK